VKQLVLLLFALLQAPESSVDGVAIRLGTTDPVPQASVLLTKVDGQLADARAVRADERGRFVFGGIAPGRYRLSAHHDAFMRADTAVFAVEPGQPLRNLTVTMTPTGVLSGRIVDAYGDAAAKVYVRATLKDSAYEALKESSFEAQTNDVGEYRVFGLPPGTYVVSASPYLAPHIAGATLVMPTPPGPYSRGEGRGMTQVARLLQAGDYVPFMAVRGESYARVYYPGTTDDGGAITVAVQPGAIVGGIDLMVTVTKP